MVSVIAPRLPWHPIFEDHDDVSKVGVLDFFRLTNISRFEFDAAALTPGSNDPIGMSGGVSKLLRSVGTYPVRSSVFHVDGLVGRRPSDIWSRLVVAVLCWRIPGSILMGTHRHQGPMTLCKRFVSFRCGWSAQVRSGHEFDSSTSPSTSDKSVRMICRMDGWPRQPSQLHSLDLH
ncbi:hypothetical protein SCLCIDRAFT_34755 [Scleroderma citrinum Foug A]|uniref:Uncharacterized protein n=1 Tax=Scleroderma citrinum Foug A TaxID=1036808 RepID=A0A0C2ZA96_9AGAM|nr:hypothetical protein SCLCIDRAFT_34755 [Scleroderma citrinum Foug A]